MKSKSSQPGNRNTDSELLGPWELNPEGGRQVKTKLRQTGREQKTSCGEKFRSCYYKHFNFSVSIMLFLLQKDKVSFLSWHEDPPGFRSSPQINKEKTNVSLQLSSCVFNKRKVVPSEAHLVPGTCLRQRTGPSVNPPWATLKSLSAQRPWTHQSNV